jgi:hypothetical protein
MVEMSEEKNVLQQIANACNGEIENAGVLSDGSGFAVMSMPLPKDHWIYGDPSAENEGFEPPPMVFRMGTTSKALICSFGTYEKLHVVTRTEFADMIRAAGRYAVRAATMKGKDMDFDPDSLLQNLVVGFLGYWTPGDRVPHLSPDGAHSPGEFFDLPTVLAVGGTHEGAVGWLPLGIFEVIANA